jgi:hypothetical protein
LICHAAMILVRRRGGKCKKEDKGLVRVLDLTQLLTSKNGDVDEISPYYNYSVASHGEREDNG